MIETKQLPDEDEEVKEPLFNGSVLTLQRMDKLIQHVSEYHVNGHIIGYRENLDELRIESRGCLTKEELRKADNDWREIRSIKITVDDEGVISFDSELPELLDRFNEWIRLKLHRHGVTMGAKNDRAFGVEKLTKRYKLGETYG